jgi:hypothetical protein
MSRARIGVSSFCRTDPKGAHFIGTFRSHSLEYRHARPAWFSPLSWFDGPAMGACHTLTSGLLKNFLDRGWVERAVDASIVLRVLSLPSVCSSVNV